MSIYQELQQRIEEEAARYPSHKLAEARVLLTERYRSPERKKTQTFIDSDIQRAAYLATRMPATFSVLEHVLGQVHVPVYSLLDLGSGPGTALWAASARFPQLESATLLEKDAGMVAIAKRLKPPVSFPVTWEKQDIVGAASFPAHDLIVISYALNELDLALIPSLMQKVWEAARVGVVIVEPGTPHGFSFIRAARQKLIDMGGCITAPCPHQMACPIPEGDWCHFAERVSRSSLHRKVKEAERGFEDEKYSYVIAMRTPGPSYDARIIRAPQHHSGHTTLSLCKSDGTLAQETFSRRQGDFYKEVRKLPWGAKIHYP